MTCFKRSVFIAALLVLAACTSAGAKESPKPHISAPSAIVVDAQDGRVLYRRRERDRRPIASTTKLMTALVALDKLPLGKRVRAAAYTPGPAETQIDLRPGERMAVADLLRALLLASASDAAETLAVRSAGSVRRFVGLMNERARKLGLEQTHFANPIGLDDPAARSTALDLSRLARRAMANDFLAATVDMPRARLGTGARPRIVTNRNRLVGRYPFVDGVKTGHTAGAGYVLVGAAKQKGARVVSVVLGDGSEAARDADTLALLRHGLSFYRRVTPVQAGATLAHAQVKYFGDRETSLVAGRPVGLTVRRGQRVRTVVDAPGTVTGPLDRGARVGTVRVFRGGRVVRTVPLVTAEAVPAAGFLRKAWRLAIPILLIGAGIALALAVRRRRRPAAPPVGRPASAE